MLLSLSSCRHVPALDKSNGESGCQSSPRPFGNTHQRGELPLPPPEQAIPDIPSRNLPVPYRENGKFGMVRMLHGSHSQPSWFATSFRVIKPVSASLARSVLRLGSQVRRGAMQVTAASSSTQGRLSGAPPFPYSFELIRAC